MSLSRGRLQQRLPAMEPIWSLSGSIVSAEGTSTHRDHSLIRDDHLNIIRLPAGEQASYSSDRIHVWRTKTGDYHWTGALIDEGDAAFACGKGFQSSASAEAEGIAWAQGYVVRVLMIQLGAQ